MPKQSDFMHNCNLPEEARDEVVISPYWGFYGRCFFKWRTYATVYLHQDSRQYFRSNASFLREKNRHLYTPEYKYVIHPFSKFAMRKRVVVSVLWFMAFILLPYFTCFSVRKYLVNNAGDTVLWEMYVLAALDILFSIDIMFRFLVGHKIEQTREIVLAPNRIVKHYLRTFFPFDIVPIVVDFITISTRQFLSSRIRILVIQVHVFRIPRIKTMLDNFDLMLRYMKMKESVRICVLHGILVILILHGWACVLGLIPVWRIIYQIPSKNSWLARLEEDEHKFNLSTTSTTTLYKRHEAIVSDYFHCMTTAMCHFFGAGVGRYKTTSSIEMFIMSLIILTGFNFYIFTLARILNLFGMVNISETKYEELMTQVGEYMVAKRFPTRLKKRIHMFYEYKYNKTFFSEHKILGTLSEHLRMEILLYSCSNLVEKVQIFKGLSKSAVGCILALLKQEIYLPEDIIMSPDDNSGTIYFILYGTCSVKLLSSKEVIHSEDGNHFGNIEEYTTHAARDFLYYVEAIEPCEVYQLERQDIKQAALMYPEVISKVENMAKASVRYYNSFLSTTDIDDDDGITLDVISELRRGRILESSRRRMSFA